MIEVLGFALLLILVVGVMSWIGAPHWMYALVAVLAVLFLLGTIFGGGD